MLRLTGMISSEMQEIRVIVMRKTALNLENPLRRCPLI